MSHTSFNQVFEKLLNEGSVDVSVIGNAAEVLRTSLVRKWNKHKRYYASVGFLAEDKEKLGVSMSVIEPVNGDVGGTRYTLKQRALRNSYEILSSPDSPSIIDSTPGTVTSRDE